MLRTVVYSSLGATIGMLAGFAVDSSLSAILGGALASASVGFLVAVLMNTSGMLPRPFWNKPDVERFIANGIPEDGEYSVMIFYDLPWSLVHKTFVRVG